MHGWRVFLSIFSYLLSLLRSSYEVILDLSMSFMAAC